MNSSSSSSSEIVIDNSSRGSLNGSTSKENLLNDENYLIIDSKKVLKPLNVIEQLYQEDFPIEQFYDNELKVEELLYEREIHIEKKLLGFIIFTKIFIVLKCILFPVGMIFDIFGYWWVNIVSRLGILTYTIITFITLSSKIFLTIFFREGNSLTAFGIFFCILVVVDSLNILLLLYINIGIAHFEDEALDFIRMNATIRSCCNDFK